MIFEILFFPAKSRMVLTVAEIDPLELRTEVRAPRSSADAGGVKHGHAGQARSQPVAAIPRKAPSIGV